MYVLVDKNDDSELSVEKKGIHSVTLGFMWSLPLHKLSVIIIIIMIIIIIIIMIIIIIWLPYTKILHYFLTTEDTRPIMDRPLKNKCRIKTSQDKTYSPGKF